MTIQRYQATSPANCIPGDLVRIAVAGGANILGLPHTPRMLAEGAFGRVIRQDDGRLAVRMHEAMPEDIRRLQNISLTDDTMVERVMCDNENELSVLALQYLRNLSDFVRDRASGGQEGVKALLRASIGREAEALAQNLAQSGLAVVEQATVKVVTTKRVYITSAPDELRNGNIPSNAIAFDVPPEESVSQTIEVHDATRVSEILLSPNRVRDAQVTPGTAVAQAQPELTPFMRTLLGLEGPLSADDIGLQIPGSDDDDDDDDYQRPALG